MSVDDLRRRLRAGADEVGRGHVRVDAARALAKLRDHRLADPHHYVLEILRAAAASGAQTVRIREDTDDLELAFDGRPFPADVIRDLFSHSIGGSGGEEEARYRLLALGVNAALALGPKHVDVVGSGVRLRARPPDDLDVEEAEPLPEGTTTRVHVRRRVTWRAVRAAVTGSPEAAAIREHARHFPAALWLGADRVDRPVGWPDVAALAGRETTRDGRRIVALVPAAPLLASRLTLDVCGVVVTTRTVTLPGLQLLVWARADGLRRNASGSDVVEDDPAFVALRAELDELSVALVEDLLRALDGPRAEEARALLWSAGGVAAAGSAASPMLACLQSAPLIPGPAGERQPPAAFAAELAAGRPIRYAAEPYPRELYEPPVVLLPPGEAPPWAALLPRGPLVDVEPEVETRRQREKNRIRWVAQPVETAALADRDFVARGPLAAGDYRGEVGLVDYLVTPTVRFLREGKLLEQRMVRPLSPLRLAAVVDSPRIAPDAAWRGVAEDAGYQGALAAIRDAAARTLAAALAAGEPSEVLRAHARDAVSALPFVPAAIHEAPIYPLAGGGWASLADLAGWAELRWVGRDWPAPALDGKPVAILRGDAEAIGRRLSRAPVDYGPRLIREVEIRGRMAAPREAARLTEPMLVTVPVRRQGMSGEIGLPERPASAHLLARLLRDGVRLEETALPARYGAAVAVVDCPALTPDEDWTGAVDDVAQQRVLIAVRDAERELVGAILARWPGVPLAELPPPARDTLSRFLVDDLGTPAGRRAPDEPRAAAAKALLFTGTRGPLSLTDLDAAAVADGRILHLDPSLAGDVPQSLGAVVCDGATVALLDRLFEQPVVNAAGELARWTAREEFAARREEAAEAPAGLPMRVRVDEQGVVGEVAHRPDFPPGAVVEVLVRRRRFCKAELTWPIPLAAAFDVDDPAIDPGGPAALPPQVEARLERALARAERDLATLAAEDPDAPGAAQLALDLLAHHSEEHFPPQLAARLLDLRLYPTTLGDRIPARELDRRKRVAYVTEPLAGRLTGEPAVLVATDVYVRAGLARWEGRRIDVTTQLGAELAERRALEAIPTAARIAVAGNVLRRHPLRGEGLEGELALVAGDGPSEIVFYVDRRPLVTEPLDVPAGVVAAIACDRLKLGKSGRTLHRNRAYRKLLWQVLDELEALVGNAAAAWDGLSLVERQWLEPLLGRLVLWLAGRPGTADSNLAMAAPVLRATDGRPLSVLDLDAAQRRDGHVPCAEVDGGLVDPTRWVWRPRPGEREALAPGRLELRDVRESLEGAARFRARATVGRLDAPIVSRWRAQVVAAGVEGEVALHDEPSGKLVIELLHARRLLETLKVDHPVGGVARVDAAQITPDPSWSRAEPGPARDAVVRAVDEALERALAELLRAGSAFASFQPHLFAALRWKLGKDGPIAALLPQLPLFVAHDGSPVTLGRVLAGTGVSVVDRAISGPIPTDRLVLGVTPDDHALLRVLKLQVDDLTAQVSAAADRQQRIAARRLARLCYRGGSLLVIEVSADGWRGELALPDPPDPEAAVVLAREGVAVDRWRLGTLGVAGVLEHAELPVNADWDQARLEAEHERALRGFVDTLFARLAATDPGPARRPTALRYALRRLHADGVTAPAHLDRAGEPAAALSRAKLVPTADGRWIDVRAVADRVLRRGAVAVVTGPIPTREVGSDVVLLASAANAPWIEELEAVLGAKSVVRLGSVEAWREHHAEEDPAKDSPLGRGLMRLRNAAELLRSSACGSLSPELLREVRLRRGRGAQPVRYDRRRSVATVDPEHAGARRALERAEEEPDGLYVLLAAIYGAVNRAHDQITDANEAELCGALLEHLARNPR